MEFSHKEYTTALSVIVHAMPGIFTTPQARIVLTIIEKAEAEHPDAGRWSELKEVATRVVARAEAKAA